MHFDKYDETYELILPLLSVHNLVIGNMYVDIGETLHVVSLNDPSVKCDIKFERRGWFTNEAYKFTGESWQEKGKLRQPGF